MLWLRIRSFGVWLIRKADSHTSQEQMREELNAMLAVGWQNWKKNPVTFERVRELSITLGHANRGEINWKEGGKRKCTN